MLVDREAPHERYSFENTGKNITDGMRHLGAVIGTIEYRENYVTQKMNNWLDELNMLCDIARIEPQAAYSCFVSWYKHKLTYITIPNISHLLEKIDALIVTKIIPAITGGIYVNPDERYLLSLPAKYDGLGLPIFSELADVEFQNCNDFEQPVSVGPVSPWIMLFHARNEDL